MATTAIHRLRCCCSNCDRPVNSVDHWLNRNGESTWKSAIASGGSSSRYIHPPCRKRDHSTRSKMRPNSHAVSRIMGRAMCVPSQGIFSPASVSARKIMIAQKATNSVNGMRRSRFGPHSSRRRISSTVSMAGAGVSPSIPGTSTISPGSGELLTMSASVDSRRRRAVSRSRRKAQKPTSPAMLARKLPIIGRYS